MKKALRYYAPNSVFSLLTEMPSMEGLEGPGPWAIKVKLTVLPTAEFKEWAEKYRVKFRLSFQKKTDAVILTFYSERSVILFKLWKK